VASFQDQLSKHEFYPLGQVTWRFDINPPRLNIWEFFEEQEMAQPNEELEDPIIRDWAERDAVWKEAWQAKFRTMADLEECLRVIGHKPLNPNLSVAKQQEDWDLRNDTHFGDEAELIYSFGPRPVEDAAHDSRVLDRMSRMPTKANKLPLTYPPGTERTTLVDQPARADGKKADAADEFGSVTPEMPVSTANKVQPEPAVLEEPREYTPLRRERADADTANALTRPSPAAPAPKAQPAVPVTTDDAALTLSPEVQAALIAAKNDSMVEELPSDAAVKAAQAAWRDREAKRQGARSGRAATAARSASAAANKRIPAAEAASTSDPSSDAGTAPSAPIATPTVDPPIAAPAAGETPEEKASTTGNNGPTTDRLGVETPVPPPPDVLIRPYSRTVIATIAAAFIALFIGAGGLGIKVSEHLARTNPSSRAAVAPRRERTRTALPTKRVDGRQAQTVRQPPVQPTTTAPAPSPAAPPRQAPSLARCVSAEDYGAMTPDRQAPYTGVCTYNDRRTVAFRCLRNEQHDMRSECGAIATRCPTLDPTCLARQHRHTNARVAEQR
jgi:hypothetical protein